MKTRWVYIFRGDESAHYEAKTDCTNKAISLSTKTES